MTNIRRNEAIAPLPTLLCWLSTVVCLLLSVYYVRLLCK